MLAVRWSFPQTFVSSQQAATRQHAQPQTIFSYIKKTRQITVIMAKNNKTIYPAMQARNRTKGHIWRIIRRYRQVLKTRQPASSSCAKKKENESLRVAHFICFFNTWRLYFRQIDSPDFPSASSAARSRLQAALPAAAAGAPRADCPGKALPRSDAARSKPAHSPAP